MKTPTNNPNKSMGGKFTPPSLDEMASHARIGRREPPPPDDPKERRWLYGRGLLLGALVVALVIILIIVIATMSENPFSA